MCNLAFSLTSALGLTSFVVPPTAPLGPNEVIVALRPVLEACVGAFPPAPARQCVATDLYPSTGLPLTLPDPVGILTEQVEATVGLLDPLGVPITSPLHELFVSVLRCRDLVEASRGDPDADRAERTPASLPATVVTSAAPAAASSPAPPTTAAAGHSDRLAGSRVRGSLAAGAAPVPAPLRGGAAVGAAFAALAGALALRRLLAPRRSVSLLDRVPPR